jgi:hypothetical protein
MERLMNYEIATFQGQDRSRFWDIMLMTDESFILRPIRALDTIAYFFPGVDYLQRRYGANSWTTRLEHLGRATGQFARLGFDTAYYSLKRSRRRKVLEQSVPEADLPQGNS